MKRERGMDAVADLSVQAQSLWAKKENRDGQELWLPLIVHLLDTEHVINWLCWHFLNDHQRELLQAELSVAELQRLVKFIGYMHDIGKASAAFQTKSSYQRDHELDNELLEKLLQSGFEKLNEFEPSSRNKSPHARAGETILEENGLNESVAAIIGAHHGKPDEKYFDYQKQLTVYTSNYYQVDQGKESELWKKVQDELINYGLNESGYVNLQEVPTVTQQQAVILTGLLIMADWVASSENLNSNPDKPMFPLIRLDQGYSDLDLESRFEQAINFWDLSDHWIPQPVGDIAQHYNKRWNFKPRKFQEQMSSAIGKITDPGLIIVESGMGSGKTEISLTAVEQLSVMSRTTGFYMGLPTQATSNAMFSRVKNWVNSLAEEEQANLPIKLMHGKAQFNTENSGLPRAENIDDSGAVVVNSWFSGKKSMLADFSIGTIDHLLLMSLKQKHLFLRHLGLSGKVVVIDEIHSYDAFMNSYLQRTLQWLGAYHIPVIALSATLAKEKRSAFVKAYYQGKYGHRLQTSGKWEENQAYPLLTYLDGKKVKQLDDFSIKEASKENKIVRFNGDDQQLINKIIETINHRGVAGVIVNTVKRAQRLAQLVPKNIPTIILHSAFLAPDRERLEKRLQNYIGKNAERPEKMIVIGTQVLEQSLDIDFDVLFTDIAPIDLILQRMGRLHRHNITRPTEVKNPTTYILGINSFGDYGDANEAVYERYYLMKTDYFLTDKVILPDDISPLVQRVYDQTNDEGIDNLSDSRLKMVDNQQKEKRKAKVYQIEKPKFKNNLHGWLDRNQQGIESDAKVEAAVRDIKESIEVLLLQHTSQGDFLLDGRKITEVPEELVAQQLIRIPAAITPDIAKAIDKLEKLTDKYYHAWENSIWLKGVLVLPLDENCETVFETMPNYRYKISYSKTLGLRYEREQEDE